MENLYGLIIVLGSIAIMIAILRSMYVKISTDNHNLQEYEQKMKEEGTWHLYESKEL